MRYFFHIVDRYGLFPDRTGCEHADQDAALEHARRIAAELAKTGEFFRSSFVFVARAAAPCSPPGSDQSSAARVEDA
ncbi:DUF6894 family protein [Bradyrhizobium iriomotense]|uniref:DUF6894 domain-containing protein n=1 Tax=Bradyrhizobium iriomotense TaxID=441950 RepID=A0ABQ6AQM7_9BRAD|nr:hypothetical protein GCM10007857_11590 [Bradyrhizobium iriomotense]